MANPPRAKGTKHEGEVLALVQQIWPNADRAKAGNASCDIVGVPFTLECKHRKVWSVPDWVRKIRAVGNPRWAIFASPGDRRVVGHPGDVVILPREFALELLGAWAVHVAIPKASPEIWKWLMEDADG